MKIEITKEEIRKRILADTSQAEDYGNGFKVVRAEEDKLQEIAGEVVGELIAEKKICFAQFLEPDYLGWMMKTEDVNEDFFETTLDCAITAVGEGCRVTVVSGGSEPGELFLERWREAEKKVLASAKAFRWRRRYYSTASALQKAKDDWNAKHGRNLARSAAGC